MSSKVEMGAHLGPVLQEQKSRARGAEIFLQIPGPPPVLQRPRPIPQLGQGSLLGSPVLRPRLQHTCDADTLHTFV